VDFASLKEILYQTIFLIILIPIALIIGKLFLKKIRKVDKEKER
jgi:hypothetical protein